jgi:hypothetical protein
MEFEPDSPNLTSLLIGQNQPIYSSDIVPDVFSATAISSIPQPGFPSSGISFSQAPRPPLHPPKKPEISGSRITKQLQDAHEITDRLSARLASYDSSRRAKAKSQSNGMETKFFNPLQKRIKNQVQIAVNFADTKQAMIKGMDAHPVPIRSGQELPPVPHLTVMMGGLADPVERFAKRREAEKLFERQICSELGHPILEVVKPERKTLDWQFYELRRETRFFDGDQPAHRGKRLVKKETFENNGTILGNKDF